MIFDPHKYNSKSISELKLIKPCWAVGDNIGSLLDDRISPSYGEYTIRLINTKALINCSDFYEVNLKSLFDADNSINDRRIARILYFWENKKYLDPPLVHYASCSNKIVFSDGRHRAKLSFFLEITEIPVAIDIDNLKKILDLLAKAKLHNL